MYKYNFKSLQKLSLLTLESLRLSGNEFQADGPSTEKARRPYSIGSNLTFVWQIPSPPLPSLFSSLEVGPLNPAGGSGECFSSPVGSEQSPADKRFWVDFELKIALLVIASLNEFFNGPK